MPNENDLQNSRNDIGMEIENDLLRHASGGDAVSQKGILSRWAKHTKPENSHIRRIRREQSKKEALDWTYALIAAVPFWAVAGTTLRNALALSVLLLVLMIPSAYLHFILRRRLDLAEWIALPVAVLVATMLASACCFLMIQVDATFYSSLGIYFFLLAAAPVVLNAASYNKTADSRRFWVDTFRFIRDFVIIMLFTGAIRELLGYNSLLGQAIPFPLRTEAAGMPFFGLILSGFLLAVLRALEVLLSYALFHRKKAESTAEETAEEVGK